mmetsp:Transcript_63705/g.132646  ORF Transcript_63705/g.132646 Transcript_63705/m.132646 type:complete len:229 (-) Transcript_63705:22-708(-)
MTAMSPLINAKPVRRPPLSPSEGLPSPRRPPADVPTEPSTTQLSGTPIAMATIAMTEASSTASPAAITKLPGTRVVPKMGGVPPGHSAEEGQRVHSSKGLDGSEMYQPSPHGSHRCLSRPVWFCSLCPGGQPTRCSSPSRTIHVPLTSWPSEQLHGVLRNAHDLSAHTAATGHTAHFTTGESVAIAYSSGRHSHAEGSVCPSLPLVVAPSLHATHTLDVVPPSSPDCA